MDYEKLIRRLRNDADAYRNGKSLGRAFADQEDVLDNAATALSTLQAENEKLRAELEQAGAEITRLKYYEDKCHDCPIVCAKTEIIKAHEELEAVQAELEQVKRDFDGICEYIDSEGFLRKQFCENGNPDLEPCICPSLQEHPGYIDSDDCEGCDRFCNSWRGQKED